MLWKSCDAAKNDSHMDAINRQSKAFQDYTLQSFVIDKVFTGTSPGEGQPEPLSAGAEPESRQGPGLLERPSGMR
jgi:hypothetical protein